MLRRGFVFALPIFLQASLRMHHPVAPRTMKGSNEQTFAEHCRTACAGSSRPSPKLRQGGTGADTPGYGDLFSSGEIRALAAGRSYGGIDEPPPPRSVRFGSEAGIAAQRKYDRHQPSSLYRSVFTTLIPVPLRSQGCSAPSTSDCAGHRSCWRPSCCLCSGSSACQRRCSDWPAAATPRRAGRPA